MADQKISELTALTGANLADVDAFAVVDTSAVQTKKITYAELKTALDTGTGFVRITGDTMTGNLLFGDSVQAQFGDSQDLRIYHDNTHSYIQDAGSGQLKFKTNGAAVQIIDGSNNLMINAQTGSSVDLYHSGSLKLATTSSGISVDGDITLGDNEKAIFGAGSDLQIYSDGSYSYLQEGAGTSGIRITSDNQVAIRKHDDEDIAVFNIDGAVRFYHNNAQKFSTTSTGIDITGTVTSDGLTVDGDVALNGITTFTDSNVRVDFMESDTTDVNSRLQISSGSMLFRTINDAKSSATTRMEINNSTGDISFYDDTGTAKFFWDASAESLGIGEVPQTDLNIAYNHLQIGKPINIMGADTTGGLWLSSGAFFNTGGNWEYLVSSETVSSLTMTNSIPFRFRYAAAGTAGNTFSWSEALRIDDGGSLLVGTTNTDPAFNNVTGQSMASTGQLQVTRDGGTAALFNRKTSDGEIVSFRKDGATVGNIGTASSTTYVAGDASGIRLGGTAFMPSTTTGANKDASVSLGHSAVRFADIYATNGTIQTSDQTEKQDIAALTSTEMLVAKRISTLFKTFRWKNKVAAKGDNARTHTGIIAQDVQAAFTAEGLDAGDYSLFISSTWLVDSEGDKVAEGTEGATSKTRMGIRYPELLSFVAAYNEQRFASIETRLTALEG